MRDLSSPALIEHVQRLAESYRRFTGRELIGAASPEGLAHTLEEAPFVVLSHGCEADPVLNYGNRSARNLWEMEWETLVRTPSRLTAEAPDREARARLLAQVAEAGYADGYSGVRISATGRRFRIEQATIWNVVDGEGRLWGQAAAFARWVFL